MHTVGSDIPVYNVKDLKIKFSINVKNDIWSFKECNRWYDDLEFIVVNKGCALFNVNGKAYRINEGQMLFINSRQMHFNVWDEDGDWSYKQLTVHPDVMFSCDALLKYYDLLCGKGSMPFLIFSKGSSRQNEIIEAVSKVFESVMKGNEFIIASEVLKLGSVMLNYIQSIPADNLKEDKKLESMHKMIGYIQTNYSKKMTIKDIGESADMGRSKCCELFKEYWNTSPIDYLNNYRLLKSVEQYMDMSKSVAKIARECGFNSQSYYAEMFKKVTGRTPTEYRESQLGIFSKERFKENN